MYRAVPPGAFRVCVAGHDGAGVRVAQVTDGDDHREWVRNDDHRCRRDRKSGDSVVGERDDIRFHAHEQHLGGAERLDHGISVERDDLSVQVCEQCEIRDVLRGLNDPDEYQYRGL